MTYNHNLYLRLALVVFITIANLCLNAQHTINYWYTGHQNANMTTNEPDTGGIRDFGLNIINFKTDPIQITRYAKSLGISFNGVNMWNDKGELLFYSNGSKVFNYEHKLIENADSLNYSSFWDNTFGQGYYADYLIGSYPRSIMAFQSPANPNQYYLVSTIMNYDSLAQTEWLRFNKVVYSLIDMSLNGGKGKMIVKEKLLLWGDFSHALSACRHANGKDWWIVSRGYQDTNCYYFYKLDNQGIRYDHKQCIGINYRMKYTVGENDSLTLSYGSAFSNDGKKFAILSYKGLELFDFNRCTGLFSNFKFSKYPYGDTAKGYTLFQGVGAPCFSPNSQLVYIDHGRRLYQFDVSSSSFESSGIRVATWDGFLDHLNGDTTLVGFQTTFSTMQLAPNSKIYVGNGETARYMTEIEFPDKRGTACNVRQHTYRLKTYMGGVPYYPNYKLGADTCAGSAIQSSVNGGQWSVYPNPARDYIMLQFYSSPRVKDVYISDMLGREFRPDLIEEDMYSAKYHVSDLPRGMYLVRVNDKLVKLMLE